MASKRRAIAVGIGGAALCLATTATAATPQHGDYIERGNGPNAVIDLNVLTNLTQMQPNFYNKCSKKPVAYLVKIKANGKFSFQGTKTDIDGKRVKIDIDGKFVSSARATGTVDYDSGNCNGKPVDFNAKFSGVVS
jgi:hypothetical protein